MKLKHLFLLKILLVSFTAFSQSTSQEKSWQLKTFGVGINTCVDKLSWEYPYSSTSGFFTFNIEDRIRFEPEIGFFRNKEERDNPEISKTDQINLILSTYGIIHENKVSILYGVKLGYLYYRSENKYAGISELSKSKSDGLLFGPVLGLEYFLSDNFSIGGEFFIRYMNRKGYWSNGDDFKEKAITSGAGIKLHYYFKK